MFLTEPTRLKLDFCSKKVFELEISNFIFFGRQIELANILNTIGNLLKNLPLTMEVILLSQLRSVLVFF